MGETDRAGSRLQQWCQGGLVGVVAGHPEEHGTSGFYLRSLTSVSEPPAVLLGQQV